MSKSKPLSKATKRKFALAQEKREARWKQAEWRAPEGEAVPKPGLVRRSVRIRDLKEVGGAAQRSEAAAVEPVRRSHSDEAASYILVEPPARKSGPQVVSFPKAPEVWDKAHIAVETQHLWVYSVSFVDGRSGAQHDFLLRTKVALPGSLIFDVKHLGHDQSYTIEESGRMLIPHEVVARNMADVDRLIGGPLDAITERKYCWLVEPAEEYGDTLCPLRVMSDVEGHLLAEELVRTKLPAGARLDLVRAALRVGSAPSPQDQRRELAGAALCHTLIAGRYTASFLRWINGDSRHGWVRKRVDKVLSDGSLQRRLISSGVAAHLNVEGVTHYSPRPATDLDEASGASASRRIICAVFESSGVGPQGAWVKADLTAVNQALNSLDIGVAREAFGGSDGENPFETVLAHTFTGSDKTWSVLARDRLGYDFHDGRWLNVLEGLGHEDKNRERSILQNLGQSLLDCLSTLFAFFEGRDADFGSDAQQIKQTVVTWAQPELVEQLCGRDIRLPDGWAAHDKAKYHFILCSLAAAYLDSGGQLGGPATILNISTLRAGPCMNICSVPHSGDPLTDEERLWEFEDSPAPDD